MEKPTFTRSSNVTMKTSDTGDVTLTKETPLSKTVERKPREERGAAWEKVDRNGKKYISLKLEVNGKIEHIPLFVNGFKKSPDDGLPDYIAFKD